MPYAFHERIFRTLCLFQAIVAFPTILFLGTWVWEEIMEYGYTGIYNFIKHLALSFFAAGILFIIIVQRYNPFTPLITLRFEIAKSTLAGATWLWLLLDSIFGKAPPYYYFNRRANIVKCAISVLVLIFVFFPTLVYGYLLKNHGDKVRNFGRTEENDVTSSERDPLLGSSV
ncbi:hypothetical protein HYALB_00003981 [Hymenoscyphus albidus]|uniref:Uncharacterized protein n=1 Tax=Hymenoscyphus albidus TaxID=595503 RepID=A0A9N9QAR3_9HELO|nr:hypothetical protein HYALB_00003981 [Hymenoscyphus albidus]